MGILVMGIHACLRFPKVLGLLCALMVGIAGVSAPGLAGTGFHAFGPAAGTPAPPAYIPPFTNYELYGAAGVFPDAHPPWVIMSLQLESSINGGPYQFKGGEPSANGITVSKLWTVVNQQYNVSVEWRERAFFLNVEPPGAAQFDYKYCGPYTS